MLQQTYMNSSFEQMPVLPRPAHPWEEATMGLRTVMEEGEEEEEEDQAGRARQVSM